MGFKNTILLASAFALTALSAPLNVGVNVNAGVTDNATSLTPEMLIKIAPKTASCSGAQYPEECADATKAATALNKSFKTYDVTSVNEQAAIIAYTLFESVSYTQSTNKGRVGQGTRMMAMPPWVKKYATAVVGEEKVAAAGGDAAVLALVNSDDEKSFGSAAWYLTTVCTPEVRAGLAAGTVDGWHNFLTQCVETTLTEERDTPWVAAKQAMLGA